MPEIDPLVIAYSHLKEFPRADHALQTLKKIASLVKPIMRARGWKVRQLTEFYPNEQNLLGLNVNRGQKICLRLRYPGDRNQFLPLEQVTDTMLHELSHNVHGPHDAKFHALWDQLRDEHEALAMKGYTGEGFLSEGYRLGGRGAVPMHEARRLARAAAEKRRNLGAGSGQRLGGRPLRPGEDIRRVIVSAVERRNQTLRGCANDTHNEEEIRAIADTATKNGFRTQAEEDAANEAAIAQALWELVQEDEKVKYGDSYRPVTASNPTGSGGSQPQTGVAGKSSPSPIPPSVPVTQSHSHTSHNISANSDADRVTTPTSWTCQICTLQNPLNYLCCDACGTERAEDISSGLARRTAKRQRTETVDLTAGPAKGTQSPRPAQKPNSKSYGGHPTSEHLPLETRTWTCSFCGREREWSYWSCDLCGKIKESS